MESIQISELKLQNKQPLKVTYRVENTEELTTRVNKPSIWIPLHKSSNDQKLDYTKEALVRSDWEPSRVLLEDGGL